MCDDVNRMECDNVNRTDIVLQWESYRWNVTSGIWIIRTAPIQRDPFALFHLQIWLLCWDQMNLNLPFHVNLFKNIYNF